MLSNVRIRRKRVVPGVAPFRWRLNRALYRRIPEKKVIIMQGHRRVSYVVEEKSKTLGIGTVVSCFNRRVMFASEVRAEVDDSSYLFAVPLIAVLAI